MPVFDHAGTRLSFVYSALHSLPPTPGPSDEVLAARPTNCLIFIATVPGILLWRYARLGQQRYPHWTVFVLPLLTYEQHAADPGILHPVEVRRWGHALLLIRLLRPLPPTPGPSDEVHTDRPTEAGHSLPPSPGYSNGGTHG
jgi:hypothetical protein